MEITYLYFFVPLIITLVCTPLIQRLAVRNGVLDHPGERKVHKEPKPLMGGMALYLAFMVGAGLFFPWDRIYFTLIAITVIFLLGLLDDIYDLNPYHKLAGQIAAAVIMVYFNQSFFSVIPQFLNRYGIPDIFALILVTGWLVFMTNAFNLIDGLDGLAVGIAVITCAALVAISLINVNPLGLGLAVILLGATLGFVPYNFQPAKIFLGDAGSMLLGFSLASIYLVKIQTPVSMPLVLGSMCIFLYPVTDVFFAIFRRIKNRTSIFKGDRGHIHHILLSRGLTTRQVVFIIYLFSAFAGVSAVLFLGFPRGIAHILAFGIMAIPGAFYLLKVLINKIAGPAASYMDAHEADRKLL